MLGSHPEHPAGGCTPGLGAVWLGVYPVPERVEGMKKAFGLPEHVTPLSAIAIGYPAVRPEYMDTFLPERIHRETW